MNHRPDVGVVRVGKSRDDHELIAYRGQHATVIGWIPSGQTNARASVASDSEVGLAASLDTAFWVFSGMPIHDRPRGPVIGVFIRDTDVRGHTLKNGWVEVPLPTEAGTLTVWVPIDNKHTVR